MPPSPSTITQYPFLCISKRRFAYRFCVWISCWNLKFLLLDPNDRTGITDRRVVETSIDHPSPLTTLEYKLANRHHFVIWNRMPRTQDRRFINARIRPLSRIALNNELDQSNRLIQLSHLTERASPQQGRRYHSRIDHVKNYRIRRIQFKRQREDVRIPRIFFQLSFRPSSVKLWHGINKVQLDLLACVLRMLLNELSIDLPKIHNHICAIGHVQQNIVDLLRHRIKPAVFTDP